MLIAGSGCYCGDEGLHVNYILEFPGEVDMDCFTNPEPPLRDLNERSKISSKQITLVGVSSIFQTN